MSCKPVCKLCKHLVISNSVTFAAGTGLVINLPEGSYDDGEKYCIVVAQPIPAATTITAPVLVTIGTSLTTYPLVTKCCEPVTACGIRTRTRYSTVVVTSATGGSFKLLGNPCCSPDNSLPSIGG